MGFENGLYFLSSFLLVVGVILTYFGYKHIKENRENKESLINLGTVLLIFGIFYIAMAHWTVYATSGLTMAISNAAPCESVIANQTISGNTTSFSYKDTCLGIPVPPTAEKAFIIYTWVLYVDIISCVVGFFIMVIGFFKRSLSW